MINPRNTFPSPAADVISTHSTERLRRILFHSTPARIYLDSITSNHKDINFQVELRNFGRGGGGEGGHECFFLHFPATATATRCS